MTMDRWDVIEEIFQIIAAFAHRRIGTVARRVFIVVHAQSNPHEFVQLRRCHASVEKAELAGVFHLVCSVEQTGHCCAIE